MLSPIKQKIHQRISHLKEDAKLAISDLQAWKSDHVLPLANKAALFLDSPSIKFEDVSDCIANIAKA
nr:hypothetical protein CFP56_63435 [Quercus suber]